MSSQAPDAAFFEQIHRLLDEQLGASSPERRTAPRHSYDCIQLLAPYDGRTPPAQKDFRQVRCHDISPGGFSFFTSSVPSSKEVVAAFGAAPFAFCVAEIKYVLPAADRGSGQYLVGCRLTKRIDDEGRFRVSGD